MVICCNGVITCSVGIIPEGKPFDPVRQTAGTGVTIEVRDRFAPTTGREAESYD